METETLLNKKCDQQQKLLNITMECEKEAAGGEKGDFVGGGKKDGIKQLLSEANAIKHFGRVIL